ncbi:MAG: acyltransferase family protein [Candidatus Onthomonas sp.]
METNQLTVSKRNRVEWLDVAKGIGIFLVVYAHAMAPFNQYAYLFHMPLFFLISGFLYSPKGTFQQFLVRKIKTLYIPFVGWNIIIIILRLIPTFLKGDGSASLILFYLKRFGKIMLTIDWEGDYLGASWFLGALFLVSVAYKLLDTWVSEGKYKRGFITALFFVAGIASFYIDFPYLKSRTLMLSMFFALGYVIRLHWEELEKCFCPAGGIAALGLFVWIGHTTRANLGANEYSNIVLFLMAACLGSYLTVCISKMICDVANSAVRGIKRVLACWGRNSIDILLWQFVMFRLVSAFQFWLEGAPISNAFSKRVYITSGLWWAAYTAVGILASLLWGWLLRQGFWGKILKKLCLVR